MTKPFPIILRIVTNRLSLDFKHNGKYLKDDWYLDFVEITCYKLNQTWRFVCDQWLSKTKSDSTSVVLSLGNHALDSEKAKNLTGLTIYSIDILHH